MKEIIALQEYTDKFISLYQGEIRNIEDSLADKLIEEGIVTEHSDDSGSSGGGIDDLMIVNVSVDDNTADKTCAEVLEHLMVDGKPVVLVKGTVIYFYSGFTFNQTGSPNGAMFCSLRHDNAKMSVFIATLNSDNTVTDDFKQIAYTS